jgi:hypothetical protein
MWKTNDIRLTTEARKEKLLRDYQRELVAEDRDTPHWNIFLGNKLCRSIATEGFAYSVAGTFYLHLWDYDLPTVIDHVCGPVHRHYGIDWKLLVEEERLILRAYKNYAVSFTIYLHERNMKSCEILKIKTGEKTEEELIADIRAASERDRFEYRIDCGGAE